MFDRPPDLLTLAAASAVFGLVLSLWLIGTLLWARRRTSEGRILDERLSATAPGSGEQRVLRLWHDGREATTTVPSASRRSLLKRLVRLIRDSGWAPQRRGLILGLLCVTPLVCGVVSLALLDDVLPGMCVAAAIVLGFWIYLKHCVARHAALFDQQFVGALELAARSLRAGHPLSGAFRLVSEEFRAPVGTMFNDICQQLDLGVSLEDALQKAVAESSSDDLKLLASSVVIQMRSGGNLAEMIDRAALVIRDRMRLSRRVRILTAQTQFSKRILIALPFVVFIMLNVLNREYMDPFYTTSAGRMLLTIAGISLVLGAWAMNRLAVLRY